MTSVESFGIVVCGAGAAAVAVAPPVAAAAAEAPVLGTGLVARAVARVEGGPGDETVRGILARAAAKHMAGEAVSARAHLAEVRKV